VRIVSLLPSATEIVAALGHRGELVGRSAECDAPASVRRLPAVMKPRAWDSDRPSAEIDSRVRATRGAGQSLYVLDVPLLARLRPDVVLTQDLCAVCSVTEAEVTAACGAAGVDPTIVSLTPRTLGDVADTFEVVGNAIGASAAGRSLGESLRAAGRDHSSPTGPKVAVVEWLDPPILAGLWTPEMIGCAGGRPIGPSPGSVGHRTSWAAIRRARPDLVLLSPCSFSVARTALELSRTALGDHLLGLGAMRGLWLADEAYFSRPGPRLSDGVNLLRSLLETGAPRGPMPIQRWDPPGPSAGAVR
jgi:iron complex transport system substrate-binding protein